MKTNCLNCNHEVEFEKLLSDKLGEHLICPSCNSSFDVSVATMTDEEFETKFAKIKNHLDDNASFGGYMFETHSKELEFVFNLSKTQPKRVWTIIEGERDSLYYVNGFHLVNRLGFLITEEEAPNIEIDVVAEPPRVEKFRCLTCGECFNELIDDKCPHCGEADKDNFDCDEE